MSSNKAELVFIPSPGMGHLVSMVEVAKRLLNLNPDLSVTLLIVKLNAYVQSLTANNPFSTRLKCVILPQDDDQVGVNDVSPQQFSAALISQKLHVKDAVNNIVHRSPSDPNSNSPRLAGFVLDMLLTPMMDVANEFGVPSYVFSPSGAAFLGFALCMGALHEDRNVDIIAEFKGSDAEVAVPSFVNSVPARVFPSAVLNEDTLTLILNMARGIKQAKGIIVNTFVELESYAVESLSSNRELPPIYPVGPILNLEREGPELEDDTIMNWLDDQPPSSVVFLCFGSMGSFSGEQVKEIACGLEQSGHRFLWSLRQPLSAPEGFLDRTATIGKIIGWAPQVEILSHPAIGGFVSHCGWNSTLESLWFGIPMAAWPLYAEQQLNAFQMVVELGLAVDIKMDYHMFIEGGEVVEMVSAEKIERGIRCLMEQDSDARKRVEEISEISRRALMDVGGSSYSMLCRFNDHVMENIINR